MRTYKSVVLAVVALVATVALALSQPCPGDCDGDGQVTIGELIRGVRMALAEIPAEACFDGDGDGRVGISELIVAVRAALGVCMADTPTPTATPTGPACGDGRTDFPEECDDGATAAGDGCSATCELEAGGDVCAGIAPATGDAVRAEVVADGLANPVHVAAPPLDPHRTFIVEQAGRVRLLKTTASGRELLETPFLDISERVRSAGGNDERGLLSIAFHPDYESNGWFFVNYTCRAPHCPESFADSSTVVARFDVSVDADVADASSEKVVLAVGQPFANHNGGQVAFGPDGMLYVGMGDGGLFNDPQETGQRDDTLLGKMLRLDVDVEDAPYRRVPADNPNGRTDELGFIWAKGLRNPWRFSFDRANGNLYIGDVGQGTFEEINVQPGSSGGGENYGWDLFEGDVCFEPDPGQDDCPNPNDGFTHPVLRYGRNHGISVTGGFVYRGCALPSLDGRYFYSDFASAWLRTFVLLDGTLTDERDLTDSIAVAGTTSIDSVSSFGEDARGELYVVDRGGEVFQLVAGDR